MSEPRFLQENFGQYELLSIGTPENHISFVAARSAYIHQITLKGQPLLWNYESGEALTQNSGHRTLALVPFPNRLLHGQYTWQGQDLHFEVNKPDTASALHGFGPDAPLELFKVNLDTDRAEAVMRFMHHPSEHPKSYPFQVEFEVSLQIDCRQSTAFWQLSARNPGQMPLPVGLGWHPYFQIPDLQQSGYLMMPPHEQVELIKAIPSGKRLPGLSASSESRIPINSGWDDCFALTDMQDREVVLGSDKAKLHIRQFGHTRFTQLYVPPAGTSVAIEPMSCNVNAFQVEQEAITLAPGSSHSIGVALSLDLLS